MIWHIFRKDARLLWPICALVAVLEVCAAIPQHLMDQGTRTSQLAMLGELLPALALLGIMVVVVLAMHQDPIPGARQDWLIRPIGRMDLAVAKLLFVLMMVQLPLWVVDAAVALADGFAGPAAGVAAATRNLQIFCEFALPAMILGAITSSFVEAFIVAMAGWIAFVGLSQVVLSTLLGFDRTIGETGAAWMFSAAVDGVVLLATAAVLALQYSGRHTVAARWLVGMAGALLIYVVFLPWHLAFDIQAALSPEPTAARAIAVNFDLAGGTIPRLPVGAAPTVTTALACPAAHPRPAHPGLQRADGPR